MPHSRDLTSDRQNRTGRCFFGVGGTILTKIQRVSFREFGSTLILFWHSQLLRRDIDR